MGQYFEFTVSIFHPESGLESASQRMFSDKDDLQTLVEDYDRNGYQVLYDAAISDENINSVANTAGGAVPDANVGQEDVPGVLGGKMAWN